MSVRDTTTGAVLCTVPCTDAEDAYFSPLGTFVVAFSTPKRGTATSEPRHNLCIFRVRCCYCCPYCCDSLLYQCRLALLPLRKSRPTLNPNIVCFATRCPPLFFCCPAKVCDGGAAASMEASFHLKRLTHGTLAVQVTTTTNPNMLCAVRGVFLAVPRMLDDRTQTCRPCPSRPVLSRSLHVTSFHSTPLRRPRSGLAMSACARA